ncbi:PTS sugar transporter subunit IIA [Amphibacillus cookii]|uniref:PTS sugar transporter subunit IIA n=1 Tax=Amphibacillus cookii TaxID=767787 RepID=UPI00195D65DA|nr:fructose PTS transporter subunit IIA [Amphibacillus cookii]MBM7541007.1 PTS system fructose-specific IIA component [Amphibacillus cookii]
MLITENQIYLEQTFKDRDEVLAFIAEQAINQDVINNKTLLFDDFIAREDEYSTAVQEGIAIPHAKSAAVKQAKLYFVSLEEPISWASPDQYQVKVIFAILVPKQESGTKHIAILSALASRLMDDDFQESIFEIDQASQVLNLLKEMEEV